MCRPPPPACLTAPGGPLRTQRLGTVAARAEALAAAAEGARSGVELAPHVADLAALLSEWAEVQAPPVRAMRPSWWTRARLAWGVLAGG